MGVDIRGLSMSAKRSIHSIGISDRGDLRDRAIRAKQRRRRPWARFVGRLLTVAGLTLLFSGQIRTSLFDKSVISGIARVLDVIRRRGLVPWMHPTLADAVILVAIYLLFACLMLALAQQVRSIPGLLGSLVLSDFNRRRGSRAATIAILCSLSMPLALAISMTSHGVVSALAWTHFMLGYVYITLANEPAIIDRTLNRYAVMRTALDNPVYEETEDELEVDPNEE